MYIYLDREEAKKGVALVFKASEESIKGWDKYFEGKAVEFVGDDLPHFITYEEATDTVREATEEEKLERGQRELYENEALIDGEIVQYNPYLEKVIDNQIISKTREDFINEGVITLESEKDKARNQREKEFISIDTYEKCVLRERQPETPEMKIEVDNYIDAWKGLPNSYEDLSTPIEELYPKRPEYLDYYYKE